MDFILQSGWYYRILGWIINNCINGMNIYRIWGPYEPLCICQTTSSYDNDTLCLGEANSSSNRPTIACFAMVVISFGYKQVTNSLLCTCDQYVTWQGQCTSKSCFLPEFSFGLWVLSLPASVRPSFRQSVRPSQSLSARYLITRAS